MKRVPNSREFGTSTCKTTLEQLEIVLTLACLKRVILLEPNPQFPSPEIANGVPSRHHESITSVVGFLHLYCS